MGKSGIAFGLAQSHAPIVVLTSTIQLQEQYRDLGASLVKGRGNFDCVKYRWEEGRRIAYCDCRPGHCAYRAQKDRGLAADVAVLSYSYFLHEANMQDDNDYLVGQFDRPHQTIVCDEAHNLESHIRGLLEDGGENPTWVRDYTETLMWLHGLRMVLLSATILSPTLFYDMLGVSADAADFIQFPSPFNVSQRPLVIRPVMKVTSKATDHTKLITAIDQIAEEHPQERGIIHTHSYKLAKVLMGDLKCQNRLITHDTRTRSAALATFARRENAILVSPSMGTGVDLPDAGLRWQVIAKLPFPDLSDEVTRAKKATELGERWYNWRTASDLIQTYGRVMRSETDYGVTYLLDSNWYWWYPRNRNLIPKWVSQAIIS